MSELENVVRAYLECLDLVRGGRMRVKERKPMRQKLVAYEDKLRELTAPEPNHCPDKHCRLPKGHTGAHEMGIYVRVPHG